MNDVTTFLNYITTLAEPGETALIVKQKPRRGDDGAMTYHADGAPKATFPAFLPDLKRIKAGDSWYINTGSFILDRFVDGKPRATKEYCDYVLFMMLDDIGTKSKTPPLEPTWVMETSDGSFQWGYAFDPVEQPTKHEFVAAINAIADAGYTDPGATNAVRNCRLPGSVNLKRGRGDFAARLVEFHPDRQYTLDQICEALDVTPAEPDSSDMRSIRLTDTGKDTVLTWMDEHRMVLSQMNAEGWLSIVCPNHAQHSDNVPEARYKPLDRSFCCYHGHCQDLDSRAFLDWVADQGGPRVTPGLRDELMADLMASAQAKITPTEMFHPETDAAAQVKKAVERERGRVEMNDWFERYAYVMSDDTYFDLMDRTEISRSTFNALYRHIDCKSRHNSKRKIEAATCFDEHRQDRGAKAVTGVTYAAGEGVLVVHDGGIYANRWRDARPDVSAGAGDVSRWLDHCRWLVDDDKALEHIWDAMAFKVQFPRIKINHAILHGGDEGSGKDTMWAPFIWAVCGPQYQNRGLIDSDGLSSRWGYQLESEILILNELREPEAAARRAMANKLKPIIAAPPEMIPIERKGLHPYNMANRMFVLAFTNDPVPISIPSQDRRWFCYWSRNARMPAEAATAMWDWYKAGGFAKIAAWLMARDVSNFNPAGVPMLTEWKMNLVEQGLSMAESYLVDQIKHRLGEFSRGAVGSPFHTICASLVNGAPPGVKIPQPALLHALKEAGWIDCGRLASSDYSTKKQIYADPEVARTHNKSELRRLVEPVPLTGNVIGIR